MWTDRPGFVFLAGLTVVILVIWPAVDVYLRSIEVGIPFGYNDYGVYSTTLDRWLDGGSLYVRDDGGGFHGSYLYPPVTILLFYPFSFFDFHTAAILFGGISLLLLWVGLEAVARGLGYQLLIGERLVLLVALFGFHPALRDFKWAQLSTLLTALLCFAFYAQELGGADDRRGRVYRLTSGVMTTLGSAFKLFFATAGAHLLRDRDRLAGALGAAGLLLGLSIGIFGIETHRMYLEVLLWGKGWGPTRATYLWDTTAAYRPLHIVGRLALPLRVVGVFAVIGLTLAARHSDAPNARHATFALGVAAVPLLAPRADAHDLVVMLLPAVILLADELRRADGYPAIPVLTVLLFHLHRYGVELAVNPPSWLPASGFVSAHAPWFQPGLWATFLLVGLAAYRVAEHGSFATLRDVRRSLSAR